MKFIAPRFAFLILIATSLAGCDRMITPRSDQAVKDARRKAAEGDFKQAINLYESALDGSSSGAAEIHFQLALLYDAKMNEPLDALHHFKRYLALAPAGTHAGEVKNFVKRDELALITTLSGDSVVTRAEAARLRNDNLELRKQIDDRAAQGRMTGGPEKSARRNTTGKDDTARRPGKTAPRSHVVQPGDTLFSLSRLYYNSPDHWKDIMNANRKTVDDPGKLKVGQTLMIP